MSHPNPTFDPMDEVEMRMENNQYPNYCRRCGFITGYGGGVGREHAQCFMLDLRDNPPNNSMDWRLAELDYAQISRAEFKAYIGGNEQ